MNVFIIVYIIVKCFVRLRMIINTSIAFKNSMITFGTKKVGKMIYIISIVFSGKKEIIRNGMGRPLIQYFIKQNPNSVLT
jgi:hypothetical protein